MRELGSDRLSAEPMTVTAHTWSLESLSLDGPGVSAGLPAGATAPNDECPPNGCVGAAPRGELDRDRLYVDLERRVRQRTFELQVISELSQEIGYTLDWEELFRLTLHHLYRVVPYDVAGALLLDGGRQEFFVRALRPLETRLFAELQVRVAQAYARMRDNGGCPEAPRVHCLGESPLTAEDASLARLDSALQVPLMAGARGEVVGLLYVAARRENAFAQSQVRLAYTVASQVAVSIERLRAVRAAEQQRLEGLVENLPEGIILLNRDLRIVAANLVGRDHLKALAGGVRVGEVLPALGERSTEEVLTDCCQVRPCELVCSGEPERVFEVVAQSLDEGNDGQSNVLLIREVTAERLTQERMRQQDRLAAVGQLAAGIAHDFNNLLTGICGFAELLEMRDDLPEGARDPLRVIGTQGRRAAELIGQILDFSRRSIIQRRPLALLALLKENVKLLQRTLPETIGIELEAGPGDYLVNGDVTQLQQMVTNLAVNARDSMPAGGVLRLRLSLLPAAALLLDLDAPALTDWIVLEMSDTGAGMPPEVLEHVFEPFFTTKGPGKGTGLGLAQVYGIVKQHEGHIKVASREGEGATFTVYLPAVSLAGCRDEQEDTPPEVPRGRGETILVVEDEEHVLRVTEALLQRLGYRVLTAADGAEGLARYLENRREVNLVITDMVMPVMGGTELCDRLQIVDPQVKVIVLTGYPLGDEQADVLKNGIVEFVQKPVSLSVLARTVREALA